MNNYKVLMLHPNIKLTIHTTHTQVRQHRLEQGSLSLRRSGPCVSPPPVTASG